MASDLVNSATSDKLVEMDWTKNIEICELVANDQRQARDIVKAIKKKLSSKNTNTQLYAVMLLEMLMNNIGEHVHNQIIDTGIIPILVKIVKKKSDLPVRERIFLLLDAIQTSLGGASGKFPQYYNAYYELVNAGVQFPQRPHVVESNNPTSQPSHPASQPRKIDDIPNGELASHRHEGVASIIQKASNALEVLKEVLDAVDPHHAEGAGDEFTLDLVEQCSFQKQRVMHLVMTSQNEEIVNQYQQANHSHHEEAEEEEPEQLFRRLRKGKACARPEDEESTVEHPQLGLPGSTFHSERLNRPLIRPLSVDPPREPNPRPVATPLPPVKLMEREPPVVAIAPPSAKYSEKELPHVAIPPPPAKHIERERFFQENKTDSTVGGHMRGLSLHSSNASSSLSGSYDSSD
ncbi:target of Myb protein 1-like [Quillaja saponaria]|uniref:Target of Myb protein 1-like n=1 Tax=Quillaja saponaria TaxID=32244 RepID=A0AAD7LFN3_QUISA|nr:target of Myb protein 1-like [Quillaja saponaria]